MLCCAWTIQAQHLSFHNISSNSQLPSGETRKLCQDSDGYLWIPTSNGLARYDGYDFLFVKTDKSTRQQVLSGYVNLVSEDSSGNLWIGTNNGLFLMDKETGNISKKLTPVMDNSHIEAVLPAKDGTVWVATNRGLFAKLPNSEDFAYCTEEEWGITPTDMKTLAMDNAGYLWIGTWSEGLLRYDVRGRKVVRFKSVPELKSPHTLFFDRDRNLWAGTWGSGLLRLDNLYSSSGPNITVYRKGKSETSLLDDIIYCINQDPATGDLWIGSRSGLSILHNKDLLNPDARFENYSPSQPGRDLPFNEINSIIPTRDHYMWLSSGGGGVFCTDTRSREIEGNGLNSIRKDYGTSSVRALSHSSDGIFRLSITGYGLFEYDLEKDRYTKFQTKYIQDFIEVGEGQVLAGSETGIMVCRKGQVPRKIAVSGFTDPFITRFHRDIDGQLWVGTRENFGILTEDRRYICINRMLKNPADSIPPCLICDLASEKNGSIWAATSDNGIFHYTQTVEGYECRHFEMPLTYGAICLWSDSSKCIWVGSENGLYIIKDDVLQMVKPGDALLSNGTVVTNIREDRNGHLWIATNKGLIQMNRDKDGNPDRISLYTSSDGLMDNYIPRNTIEELEDGSFLVGSAHGISVVPLFPPIAGQDGEEEGTVAITDFKVFDKSIRGFEAKEKMGISRLSIDRSDSFTLKHSQNNFTIEFARINFRHSGSTRYAYMLEGYDSDWISTDASHRNAYYNNLKPGNYTFLVKASKSNGLWTAPRTIRIRVKPAPWASWWVKCIYVFIIALMVAIFLKIGRNRMQMQKKMEVIEINRRKSEELNHSKLQFFTNITHELMTPLTIIIAAVEELKTENPGVRQYDFISENAMRLMRLIQQILEFRKAESGNLKLKVVYGDITSFVKNCVMAFEPLSQQKQIEYKFESLGKTPIEGWFDTDKLDKILYNLLSNATKYNHPGGSVTVSMDLDIHGRNLVLKVADTGDGMGEEQLNHLFQRFYDGDYRKHNTTGTGIGLSLVKNLVDLHHGQISVESHKGEGTTFTVLIPVHQDCYTAAERESFLDVTPESTEKKIPHQHNEENTTVMVVEDNRDLLVLLEEHLAKEYNVIAVGSAEEAKVQLKENKGVKIILSDIMMPGMNGYDFCAWIKENIEYCHIPVVLITSKQTSADKITGYEVGADAYLTKPFDVNVLDAIICGLLRKVEKAGADYRKQLVFNPGELNYTTMDEKFLQQAVDYVNQHLGDFDFSLSDFTKAMNMSKSTLAEKMKTLTGMTPSGFVNNIRLNAASKIIQQTDGKIRVSEVAYAVGFNDPKYFSSLFKKKFGVNPGDYCRNANQMQ